MTVLSACAEAAIELNQAQPASLFSTTDQFPLELRTQANKSAKAILKRYEWQKFTALHTLTGDGTTTSFALPSDYDRMPRDAKLLSSVSADPLEKADSLNSWLDLQIRGYASAPGVWVILGGTIQVLPALGTGVTAKFYYIKDKIITGGTKTAFTADSDTFDLPERLITLDVIWRWRALKRKEYAEDMRNFEIALAEEMTADKGSRVLKVGRRTYPFDARTAYPGSLGS